MTSSFPFPSRIDTGAGSAPATPAVDEFASPMKPAGPARRHEKPEREFSELCDAACNGPAPDAKRDAPPPAEPAADAEPVSRVESAEDPTAATPDSVENINPEDDASRPTRRATAPAVVVILPTAVAASPTAVAASTRTTPAATPAAALLQPQTGTNPSHATPLQAATAQKPNAVPASRTANSGTPAAANAPAPAAGTPVAVTGPGSGTSAEVATTADPLPTKPSAPAAPGTAVPRPANTAAPGTEKSSGDVPVLAVPPGGGLQKHVLVADNKTDAHSHRSLGTDVASRDRMTLAAPQTPTRSHGSTELGGDRAFGGGGEAPRDGALPGKGWIPESGTTTARLGDSAAVPGAVSATATAVTTARVQVPAAAAPATPTFVAPENTVLAPVQAALERMVARAQESLAVTVRFEQGGTLSLKLSLTDGSINTHIRTDVPGLEESLRSSWNSFAQEWSQRGVKLATPTFGGGAGGLADDAGGRNASAFGDRDGSGADASAFSFPGRRRSLSSANPATASGTRPAPAPAARVDLATASGARGLHTWA